ncbi:MAG: histidine phosphatase family protein [Myxococcota bacterium]
MPRLVVVRHGQASIHKADYDELSDKGRAQATALGEHLAAQGIAFDTVFVGPARRHRDTAGLAGEAMVAAGKDWPEAVSVPTLDEHDAFSLVRGAVSMLADDPEIAARQKGLLEAQTPAARSQNFQRLFEVIMLRWLAGELSVEGVESWPQFKSRVLQALDTMQAQMGSGSRAIAFSSVGPLAVLLQRALETDDATSFRTAWRIRNASLTTLVFDRQGRVTLDGFNALPHLPDPRAWTFR